MLTVTPINSYDIRLKNGLSEQQKELLTALREKDFTTLKTMNWSFIYSSLQTLKCLGLVDYTGEIYYYEMLLDKLGE